MPPHPLINFEIQKYYQNQARFNNVCSKNNVPKIYDGVYVITHWIALYVNGDKASYFDSFGVEHIPREIEKFVDSKNITANIYKIQANDSIMCGYFGIGFIDFILKGKSLLDYTNSFSPRGYSKGTHTPKSLWKRTKAGGVGVVEAKRTYTLKKLLIVLVISALTLAWLNKFLISWYLAWQEHKSFSGI